MDWTMRGELEGIKEEISKLSEKIAQRIEQLENEAINSPVTTYRNDTMIHEAIKRIRDLYHNQLDICRRYLSADDVCSEFKNEPRVFRELDLFEACARVCLKKNQCGD